MGENYALGNRDDTNEFRPYKLDSRMFETNKVLMMACGTQHVVALSLDGSGADCPKLPESLLAAAPRNEDEKKP